MKKFFVFQLVSLRLLGFSQGFPPPHPVGSLPASGSASTIAMPVPPPPAPKVVIPPVVVPAASYNNDSIWIVNNYFKMEKMIPMRDGVKLFTSIYLPKDSSVKHPIMMTRTPYSCAPYGENKFKPFWERNTKIYLK